MKNLSANLSSIVSLVVLVVAVSACGNVANSTRTSSSNASGSNSTSINSLAAVNCASSPNVTPQGYDTSVSGQYYGCSSGAAYSGVQLFPADGTTRQVCVFPVRTNSATPVIRTSYYGPYASRFVNQCVTVSGSGTVINFGTLSFNAVLVVDAVNVATLAACIEYGDVANCASQSGISYSYGQIR